MIMLLFYKEMMYLKITFKKILVNCKIARKIENSIRYSYQGYVGSFSGILIIFVYYFLRRFFIFFRDVQHNSLEEVYLQSTETNHFGFSLPASNKRETSRQIPKRVQCFLYDQ